MKNTQGRVSEYSRLLTGHFYKTSGYSTFRDIGAPDWLMVYTAGGMGRFGHEAGEIIVRQDDWVLIQPGARHDYGVESSLAHWELVWVHFDPHPQWLSWLNWPVVHGGLMHLNIGGSVGRGVASRFMQVHQLHNSTLHRREAIAINALEDVLLQCDQHNPRAVREHGDDRVSNAIDFMEQNLQDNIGVDDIAAAVGLSTSRLAHLFRAESGQTPQNYLESLRMRRAAEMLGRTNFRVKHIAATVGYENPLYFSLRFKAWAQKSPTEFRQSATTIETSTGRKLVGR
ncbi:helix-turn-helix domain-containing protein [Devosia algicola]|uniref:Helix-turn-helix domain-containing protein n=2 Tax=Devosia algicola TaxID=3026418 RepID=A0ABY7YS94_9HYPH|nr:helix-turn-helix domain-containing protein [Devosia algicola]